MMPSSTELKALREGADSFSLSLTPEQLDQFSLYKDMLLDWNQRINLTGITGDEAIQVRHFLDSLTCLLATGELEGINLVDAGSGAGFPGLPLKIAYPGLKLTLVESVRKKSLFLVEVVRALGLSDVTIVTERLEVVGQDPAYRETFDWAVARGVAKLPILAEYLLPLCRLGGYALAQKGAGAPETVLSAAGAIEKLGGGQAKLLPVALPQRDILHYLVVIPKITSTPSQYPRRSGIPRKRPLT